MTSSSAATVTVAGRARAARTIFTRMVQAIGRRRSRYLTQCALADLPDETLRDIGLTRCEIDYVADRLADAPDGLTLPQARQ